MKRKKTAIPRKIMSDEIIFKSDGENRLDKQIAENSELTRSAAVKLLEQGSVLVDGKVAGKKDIPKLGTEIVITLPEPKNRPLKYAPLVLSVT